MHRLISVIIAILIAMSVVAAAFASEANKPIGVADDPAAISAGGIMKNKRTKNPAQKAATARTKADHKYLKAKAKTDAKDAEAKAAKEKNEADIKAANELETNLK